MSFDKKPREHKRGFTLVELVIVIAVIALLAAVLIPAFSGIIQRAKHSAALQEARGALTAFAVNTAAQTGAGGSDVYVVSKFENGPFYFICANGELKDAPEGSLNRSLEDGEIIIVAVDDSYLIEGETGLEMSDASGDVYNDYEIRYAIENKYSIHKDYGPVAGSIMLIITHPDDIPFDWNFQNDYFKLYDEQWNTPSVTYEIQPNYNDKNQIYSVTITVYNLYCNIIISTDEDKETAMNTSIDNSSIPEQSAEVSRIELYPGFFVPAEIIEEICIIDYERNTVISEESAANGLMGLSIKICLPPNFIAIMGNESFFEFEDDGFFYIIIENVTDNIYISETE